MASSAAGPKTGKKPTTRAQQAKREKIKIETEPESNETPQTIESKVCDLQLFITFYNKIEKKYAWPHIIHYWVLKNPEYCVIHS